jgi:hypothetical protein
MNTRALLAQKALHIRALSIALIVGTLLCLINQGDIIITGHIANIQWTKLILTYLVPYGVSLYSAISALKK